MSRAGDRGYLPRPRASLTSSQRRPPQPRSAQSDVGHRALRTAALGGHVARCEECTHEHIAYSSCRNRHCPKCQGAAAKDWLAAHQAELLPVPYCHVVFTGADKIWLMDGTSRKAQGKIPKLGNTDWAVAGIGDYDGSLESDILWRNGVSGANKIWLMQGFTRAAQSNIPKFGDTQWQVQR